MFDGLFAFARWIDGGWRRAKGAVLHGQGHQCREGRFDLGTFRSVRKYFIDHANTIVFAGCLVLVYRHHTVTNTSPNATEDSPCRGARLICRSSNFSLSVVWWFEKERCQFRCCFRHSDLGSKLRDPSPVTFVLVFIVRR
ncbi:hypothetical protein TNCV_3350671 [Trichonephila clavipes]|nr:hypothetical protein TNCV_3350671 [Trichonephila clavipes]